MTKTHCSRARACETIPSNNWVLPVPLGFNPSVLLWQEWEFREIAEFTLQIWRMGEPRQGLGPSQGCWFAKPAQTHLDRERQSDHPPLAHSRFQVMTLTGHPAVEASIPAVG